MSIDYRLAFELAPIGLVLSRNRSAGGGEFAPCPLDVEPDPRLQQLFGRYATYCGSSPFAAPATLSQRAKPNTRQSLDSSRVSVADSRQATRPRSAT